MSPTFEHIKKAISTLPAAERLSLWRELQAEFGSPIAENDDEETVEAAWDEEIDRRVKEIEDGTVKLLSAEEVERDINAHMAKLRLARTARHA